MLAGAFAAYGEGSEKGVGSFDEFERQGAGLGAVVMGA